MKFRDHSVLCNMFIVRTVSNPIENILLTKRSKAFRKAMYHNDDNIVTKVEKNHGIMELKIRRYSIEKTISDGLTQTADYMDHCPAGTEGHFIMFDKNKDLSWDEKIFHDVKEFNGKKIHVWGM